METSRLMAIDPSVTCSGWALFCLNRGVLLGVGRVKSAPSSYPFNQRLADLQQKITELLAAPKLGENDILITEGPTSMKDPDAAIKVEQVRSMFETLARASGVQVPGRLNPRTVQYEVMGLKGKQLPRDEVKSLAAGTVKLMYSEALRNIGFSKIDKLASYQDIVDAILVGHLALSKIESAKTAGISLEEFLEPERRKNGNRNRLQAV